MWHSSLVAAAGVIRSFYESQEERDFPSFPPNDTEESQNCLASAKHFLQWQFQMPISPL